MKTDDEIKTDIIKAISDIKTDNIEDSMQILHYLRNINYFLDNFDEHIRVLQIYEETKKKHQRYSKTNGDLDDR